jgi:[acyl-carrier-protein] S-malonyltransferase
VQALIELPPAGTLTGIARRALPGVTLQAVKSPDDLETARKLISEFGDEAGTAPANPTEGS